MGCISKASAVLFSFLPSGLDEVELRLALFISVGCVKNGVVRPAPRGVAVNRLVSPGGVMLTKRFDSGIVGRYIHEDDVVHRIGNELGVVDVCVIMIAVIRKLERSYDVAVLINEADLRNIVRSVVIHGYGLALVGCNGAVVTSAAVVVKYHAVTGPELVTEAVLLLLNEAGLGATRDGVEHPDSLLNVVPGTLVAVGDELVGVGRKLNVTEPMGVLIDRFIAGAVGCGDYDTTRLDAVEVLKKSAVVFVARLHFCVRLTAGNDGDISVIIADRRTAERVADGATGKEGVLAGGDVDSPELVGGVVEELVAVYCLVEHGRANAHGVKVGKLSSDAGFKIELEEIDGALRLFKTAVKVSVNDGFIVAGE